MSKDIDQEIINLTNLLFPAPKKVNTWSKDAIDFVHRMEHLFAGMLIGSRSTGEQIEKLIESLVRK